MLLVAVWTVDVLLVAVWTVDMLLVAVWAVEMLLVAVWTMDMLLVAVSTVQSVNVFLVAVQVTAGQNMDVLVVRSVPVTTWFNQGLPVSPSLSVSCVIFISCNKYES